MPPSAPPAASLQTCKVEAENLGWPCQIVAAQMGLVWKFSLSMCLSPDQE